MRTRPVAFFALCVWASQQRQGVVEASSRSVESGFDTNIGVFSPSGRLLQLDYVEGIVKRGNLCVGAECKDGVVLVTNKLMSADAAKLVGEEGGVRRIYRVDSHIGLLPAGLPADGRALAHKAMEYCRLHRREYGEPIPGRILAERLGEFLHAAIVRWGSRAYPNTVFIACCEEQEQREEEEEEVMEEVGKCQGTEKDDVMLEEQGNAGGDDGDVSAATGDDNDDDGCSRGQDDRVKDEANFASTAKGEQETVASGTEGAHEQRERVVAEPTAVGGVVDRRNERFRLYVVEPSGVARRYRAACTGKGSANTYQWLHRRSSPVIVDKDSTTKKVPNTTITTATAAEEGAWVGHKGGRGRVGRRFQHGAQTDDDDGYEDENEDRGSDSDEMERQRKQKDDRGGKEGDEGQEEGNSGAKWQRRPQRTGCRLLSEMTCAEASKALVRAARLGFTSKGGGGVVGVPEVAWITSAAGDAAKFVHDKSLPDEALS